MVLRFASFLSRRQCARMPLLVLGVAIAEPPTASGAMHCREIIARLIARRHCLTHAHQVFTSYFFFFHQEA